MEAGFLKIFVFSKEAHCGPRLKREKRKNCKVSEDYSSLFSRIYFITRQKIIHISGLHKSGARCCEYLKEWFLSTQNTCQIRRVSYDFLVTVKAAPHECVIRTGQP